MPFYSIHVCVWWCVCAKKTPLPRKGEGKMERRAYRKKTQTGRLQDASWSEGTLEWGCRWGRSRRWVSSGGLGCPVVTNKTQTFSLCKTNVDQADAFQTTTWTQAPYVMWFHFSGSLTSCHLNSTHFLLAKNSCLAPVRWKGSWERVFFY